jgi:restriction endonuclease S subunit
MTEQTYKLKEIATINSGYSFRTKVQNNPTGNTYVIQMRDIAEDRFGIESTPNKVDGGSINEKHLLQQGDILFMGKGANNFAVCYDEKFKPAVAASAFFMIRPDQGKVNPKYLCWYINNNRAQAFIESNRAGSYIPNVNKSVLEELEIMLPPMKLQNTIAELSQLTVKEHDLLGQIRDKRELLMNTILNDLISNNHGKE